MIPIDFNPVHHLENYVAESAPLIAGTVTFQLYVPIQEGWEVLDFWILDEAGAYDKMYVELEESV